jgi:CO dehydrogenase maturation factor
LKSPKQAAFSGQLSAISNCCTYLLQHFESKILETSDSVFFKGDDEIKLAITGKGGVGKTTLTALPAQVYADHGRDVLAVDVDPSPCLAGALGFPDELRARLNPIAEMDELIEERTGAKPGTVGGFFTLNPRVDDIPERFAVTHRGVRLLEMGSVDLGGSGCICPESAMLKTLFTHLLFRKDDVLLLDMYAGVEH